MNTPSKRSKNILQELIFLAGYFLCFFAALAFLMKQNYLYSIIFVTLHGCLSLLFVFIIHRQREDEEWDDSDDELPPPKSFSPELIGNNSTLVSQLRQEKEDLLYNNETLTNQITELKEQNESLCNLLKEAQMQTAQAMDPAVAASILPPDEQSAEVDLISLTNQIIDDMQPLCARVGIRLELSTSSDSLFYQADSRYISLMIRNIIDNSIKYMLQNGNLVITISNTGNQIFIAFKDNGRGLAQEEMPKIFDLNFQGSNRVSGNGLGLAQVRAIVEHYHGSIYARSANGMGIYIQLPLETTL